MANNEKNNRSCYNINNKEVINSMMYAANCIEDIIYNDDSLKAELNDKNKKNGLLAKLQLILFVKNIKSIYRNKNLKIYKHFEKNKDILNGKIVIKGTRITPETINNYIIKKISQKIETAEIFEQLLLDYPSITKDDINASLIYSVAKMSYIKILFSK